MVAGQDQRFTGARRSRPFGSFRFAEWKFGNGSYLESCSAHLHSRSSLSRLLPVERRRYMEPHERTARRRDDSADVPYKSGDHRLAGVPHLSRGARGQSFDRRYICVDSRLQQSGPGFFGRMHAPSPVEFAATRRLPFRSDGVPRRLRRTPASGLPRSSTATTISCLRLSLRSRIRSCWPARTTCGVAAWRWVAVGVTPRARLRA
jgi:hypothetical protein